MSSAMLMERSIGLTPTSSSPMTQPTMGPSTNYCVVPRCEIKVEKCQGGLKLNCRTDDQMACATLQNLCRMLAGGMCSCCCTYNGVMICQCNLVCGISKCEYTKDGVAITCTSGDKACAEMLQSCCENLSTCIKNGCCCYVCLNNTPICCSQN